jgi:hypothetical protein
MPENLGNYERIAPSPESDAYIRRVGGQKMFGSIAKIVPDKGMSVKQAK